MDLRDLALTLDLQPTTALLAEATGAEIFTFKAQLARWADLLDRELAARYPAAYQPPTSEV